MARSDSLSEDKRIRAWAGTADDLRRLGQLIELQLGSERDRAVAEGRRRVRLLRLRRRLLLRSTEEIDSALENVGRVHLEVKNGRNETVSDTIDRVMDDPNIDIREMEALTLSCGVDDQYCAVFLSSEMWGCRMLVNGKKQWVPGAARAIANELDDNRPWWAFLRHPVPYGLVGITFVVSAYLGLIGLGDVIDPNDKWSEGFVLAYVFGGMALIGLSAWLLARLANRLFPVVEVRTADAATTRQRVARAVGAVAGLFLGGTAVIQGISWLIDNL